MQLRGLVSALAPALLAWQAVADSLSLQVGNGAQLLTFSYDTAAPKANNWIALYSGDNVPTQDSTKYYYDAYATAGSSSGNVRVDTSKLKSGTTYRAYLLADNGYQVLAGPASVSYTSSSAVSSVSVGGKNKFAYQTTQPDSTNWIAIYAPGKAPTDESTKYSYSTYVSAPGSSGHVDSPSDALLPADYSAWYLAKNAYGVLAGPVSATGSSRTTLSLDGAKPEFTFDYETTAADKTNWVVLYPDGARPTDDATKFAYISWVYAPDAKGTVRVKANALEPGVYHAYLLARNKYTPMTDPVRVDYAGDAGPVQFLAANFTTQNARVGDAFSAGVAGLINPRRQIPSFTLVSDSSKSGWARVSANGTIGGTPARGDDGETALVLEATAEDGSKATLDVTVPVVRRGLPLVTDLKIVTMNLWVGGSQVDNGHAKQVQFLASTNADVIGFQETSGTAGARLARALGYYHSDKDDTSVLSRYPIAEVLPGTHYATAARIALDGEGSQVIVWSAHLGYTPYGPYDFCFDHMSVDQVLKREAESGRTPQMQEIVGVIKTQIPATDKVPVFLVGDFNAPSQLDWTEANKAAHCNIGYVPWPTSDIPLKAGLNDTYRELFPDPRTHPAITWSPVHPASEEPPDRLDFMYYNGAVNVLESEPMVVGTPKFVPNQADNEWPSDHKAFYSTYQLLPSAQRKKRCLEKAENRI